MNAALIGWIAAGVTTGTGHAFGLWRSARRWRRSAQAGLWRLPAIACVLAAAAAAGGLAPAAGGWACGFAGITILLAVRSVR